MKRFPVTSFLIFVMSVNLLLSASVVLAQDIELRDELNRPDPDRFDPQSNEDPIRQAYRRSFLKPAALQSGLNATQEGYLKDNCLWGKPKPNPGIDVGPTKLISRRGYALEHSSEAKVPYWVCEHSTKSEITGSLPRTNPFKADPLLAGFPRAELSDYRRSGYDRGHMAPNGNFKNDDQLRVEFFLSNMIPQVGQGFNQNIWADLEGQVRHWTHKYGETWIISGPLYYDPEEENPATADGLVNITTIGDNEVQVPTHCYKIVISKNGSDWQSIAFVMENAPHPDSDFVPHLKSIDWIEERAGFDFFPNVGPESGVASLESKLESSAATGLWH